MTEPLSCCQCHNDNYTAHVNTSSGWYSSCLHGGVATAIAYHGTKGHLPAHHIPKRLVMTLLKPVPLGPLSVKTDILRTGRRVHTQAFGLYIDQQRLAYGTLLSRPKSSHQQSIMTPYDDSMRFEHATPVDVWEGWQGQQVFASSCVWVRLAFGDPLGQPGPAGIWVKAKYPLVNDELIDPWLWSVVVADFGNAIGNVVPIDSHVFINPDLEITWFRAPKGEWLGIASETQVNGDDGLASSYLYDKNGCFAKASQTLIIQPRQLFFKE